jgi:hypothetical protein
MKVLRPPVLLVVLGAVLCVLATLLYSALRVIYDDRPAYVNVRWGPSVNDEDRQRLEKQYSLTRGEPREGRTWGYYLADLSRANIEQVVRDPAVEDTHQINREAFRVWRTASRASSPESGGPQIPRPYALLSFLLFAAGALVIGLPVVRGRLPLRR